VLAGLVVIAAIVAGVYAVVYFQGRITEDRERIAEEREQAAADRERARAFEPTITVPENVCDSLEGKRRRTWTLVVQVDDVEKVKNGVAAQIANVGGTVTHISTNQYGGQLFVPSSDPATNPSVTIGISAPITRSDALVNGVKGLIKSPDRVVSEYSYEDDTKNLKISCRATLTLVQGFATKERFYLEQLKNGSTDESVVNGLTQVRQDAVSASFGGFEENLDILTGSVTIEQLPG
jgi:hypothetical protein